LASIRKITYRKKNGQVSTYWQVSYYDSGKQQRKNFRKQAAANAHRITVESEILTGAHIPDRSSATVTAAALHFINAFERDMKAGKRERSTWKQYRSHIKLHIDPYPIASALLNSLRAPDCRLYLDDLQAKIGDSQAAKVMVTFRMILSYATERGWMQGNPASTVKVRRSSRKVRTVKIPEKSEARDIIAAAKTERDKAFVVLGFLCGLRPSELRGLPVTAIRPGNVYVNQRADEWGKIGPPKTPKGHRTIPMGVETEKAVRAWLGKAKGPLLFPSEAGTPMTYQNLLRRFWKPLLTRAKVQHYTLHEMRHFAASLWIEQGKTPKTVQDLLGHETLAMTMDTYGHLFQTSKESRDLVNQAEKSVLPTKQAQKTAK
jgi:integrase